MQNRQENSDYQPVAPMKGRQDKNGGDYSSLQPFRNGPPEEDRFSINPLRRAEGKVHQDELPPDEGGQEQISEITALDKLKEGSTEILYGRQQKLQRERKKLDKRKAGLENENWINRNGHFITFTGLYLFTFFVFFRPYELIPGLGFLSSGAFLIAVATLLVFIPVQFSSEGSFTFLNTEVKCALGLAALALLLMPISRSLPLAWETFNDVFIKAVLMFVVMVNVIRSKERLMNILWLSFGISVYISYLAIDLYSRGVFKTEGYRVSVEVKGMLENPNEMALHLVTMIPLTLCLALASKNLVWKSVYFVVTVLQFAATVVTFSRGGFLALMVSSFVLVWKLGRKARLKVSLISAAVGVATLFALPGNYGLRVLSIFIPGLDGVGSADQRKEILINSIWATLRNPWGVGIGNSVTFGIQNLQTHNAYTQVSSELGLLGLALYMTLMISPFIKLNTIEKLSISEDRADWFYYLSVGLQASIVAYMVASFFASVAYLWFVFYLIAYAVAFRRVFRISNEKVAAGGQAAAA